MMEGSSESILGKKVFFLYPPSVIREEVVNRLLEEEFEIYLIKDHAGLRRILKRYPDSLVFVNIDEGLAEKEWEQWVRDIQNDDETAGVGIGILSYNSDDELRRKYLMELGIQCGFVRMKLGVDEGTKILLDTLRANEAKGRRKYLRADCGSDPLSTVNVQVDGKSVHGNLRDISVVGLSCTFDTDPGLPKNALLPDMQLKLRGVLLNTRAIVYGKRECEDGTVYVILFAQVDDKIGKEKIRRYIQTALQAHIEAEIGR